jgi:hypothetical protein
MTEKIVGRKYKVKHSKSNYYNTGDIVTLVYDWDGSMAPFFIGNSGKKIQLLLSYTGCYINMEFLELLPETISEKVARLETELAQAKFESESKPWLKYKEGDEILIRATVKRVECPEYNGYYPVNVHISGMCNECNDDNIWPRIDDIVYNPTSH